MRGAPTTRALSVELKSSVSEMRTLKSSLMGTRGQFDDSLRMSMLCAILPFTEGDRGRLEAK